MLTHIPEQPPETSSALGRAAVPLLLFSVFLFTLLLGSRLLLVPRWAQVTVGERAFSVAELQVESAKLSASLLQAEEDRASVLLPEPDSLLASLLPLKARGDQLLSVLEDVREAAVRSSSVPGAVSLKALRAMEDGSLTVEGDVSLVSYASMSVLAQFVSRLESLTGVELTDPPDYVREDGPSGPHSPFMLTLSLAK